MPAAPGHVLFLIALWALHLQICFYMVSLAADPAFPLRLWLGSCDWPSLPEATNSVRSTLANSVPGLPAEHGPGPQTPSTPPRLESLDNNSLILGFILPMQTVHICPHPALANSLSFSPRLSAVQALYLFKEAPAIICASVLSNHTIF